jgi:hypothetical protein
VLLEAFSRLLDKGFDSGHRAQPRRNQVRRLDRRPGPEGGDLGGRVIACGPPRRSRKKSARIPGDFSSRTLRMEPPAIEASPLPTAPRRKRPSAFAALASTT